MNQECRQQATSLHTCSAMVARERSLVAATELKHLRLISMGAESEQLA